MKAVVKIPEGMDLKPGWVCAYHAPVKLLPPAGSKAHNVNSATPPAA